MAIEATEQLMAAQETTWLFSSTGMPVAFISGRSVYKTNGEFLGCLEGTAVLNEQYIGEIFAGNRFLARRFKPLYKGEKIVEENLRLLPPIPDRLEPMQLPTDFQDLGID